MSFVKKTFDAITGKSAQRDSRRAANASARNQDKWTEYLMEREEVPQQFREGALQTLGGLAGLPGGTGSQQDLIDRAMASPLYGAIMGTYDRGADAIADYASATGNLRSGNAQENLFDYGQRLSERALLESYDDQRNVLSGLSGLPSNANVIAQTGIGAGQTRAQGKIAGAQAQQDAMGNLMNLGATLYAYSDPTLKRNITPIGQRNGLTVYAWRWTDEAEAVGLVGEGVGYMADEVQRVRPDAVKEINGHLVVDYAKLERAAA